MNHNYFSDVNLFSSYWAGFISADGYVTRSGSALEIVLSARDVGHLERFLSDIGADQDRLKSYQNSDGRQCSRVYLPSRQIVEDLNKNFSITTQKSLTARPPVIAYEQSLAFIAGYIDGDGSYTTANGLPRLKIVGTKSILEWIKSTLSAGSANVRAVKNSQCYEIAYTGKVAILARSRYIEMNLPFMERKFKNWK